MDDRFYGFNKWIPKKILWLYITITNKHISELAISSLFIFTKIDTSSNIVVKKCRDHVQALINWFLFVSDIYLHYEKYQVLVLQGCFFILF